MTKTAITAQFYTKIAQKAVALMLKHGLHNWQFGWDRAKRRYGLCDHRRQRISLSMHLTPLSSEADIENTILHEIAHALVGPKHGHDRVWQAKALQIGCDATRCGKAVPIPKTFVGTCPHCQTKVYRHRRSYSSCAQCDSQFNPAYLLVWQRNPAAQVPGGEP